jgi:hypothetical protein
VKLAERTLSAQAEVVRTRMQGGSLQLWDGLTLLASFTVGDGQASGPEISFGRMGPETALANGVPSMFRVVDAGGGLILEGDANSELILEPTSQIEKGAAVTLSSMTYRQAT